MVEVQQLSQNAYDRLAAELEELTTRGRIDIARKIETARELGDLSENGDYHAAKEEQGKMEARIVHLQRLLVDAEIVAELDEDLSFRFNNTDVLFDRGEADIKPEFQAILNDFFPRYVRIITQEPYRDDILEVRIEGHTSTSWYGAKDEDEAYIRNMDLSQKRTRSTLEYVLELPAVKDSKSWLKNYLTANGLSSAKVIRDAAGVEDGERSRRVEFRVRTDAEGRIATILDRVQP